MKRKSAACSTGHGTGVLMGKPPSWPPPRSRARLYRKDEIIASVIADNRVKKKKIFDMQQEINNLRAARFDAMALASREAARAKESENRNRMRAAWEDEGVGARAGAEDVMTGSTGKRGAAPVPERPIRAFAGHYRFLSNFYPCVIPFEGLEYPSVEHAFQAAKSLSHVIRVTIAEARSAAQAKRIGGTIPLRPGWDGMRTTTMRKLVRAKFADPKLARRLLDTEERELVEGNTWGDTFWGVVNGEGKNMLGKILMEVREELRRKGDRDAEP